MTAQSTLLRGSLIVPPVGMVLWVELFRDDCLLSMPPTAAACGGRFTKPDRP